MRLFPQGIILIGLGALGSYAADMLIRNKIRVWLVDPDTVEEANLPQSLYYPSDVGKQKARVFCERYGLSEDACLSAYAENVLPQLPQDIPLLLMTDSRESRLSILTRIHPSREVWSLAIGLKEGEIMRTTAGVLIRLLEAKRGFACRSRILPPVLPPLTVSLFAHLADHLQPHDLVRMSLTSQGILVRRHTIH